MTEWFSQILNPWSGGADFTLILVIIAFGGTGIAIAWTKLRGR